MAIKINKLECRIEYNLLEERYEFYKVSTSSAYFKGGASILDAPLLENNVKAVLFERGKSFYVMMQKEALNKQKLRQVLLGDENGNGISFEKVPVRELEKYVLLQLLLNRMGNSDCKLLGFNNLTGHLYCFNPEWLIHGKNGAPDVIWKVPCVEIKITKDLILDLSVRTFTSELLKKKITFRKRRFEDYPKYVFSEHHTLRRKLKSDNGDAYILRQTDNTKTEMTFLDLQSLDKFNQSKMGVLREALHAFNDKYQGICHIELTSVEEGACIEHKRKGDRVQAEVIRQYLRSQNIRIVDQIGNDDSMMFCRELSSLIAEKYGAAAKIGTRLSRNAWNIVLIHNAAYYIELPEDPHDKKYDGYTVQHITFEDYPGNSGFALDTIVHEMLIKQDILSGRISLFDWPAMGLGKVSFGLCENIDGADRCFFMDIQPDGSFQISEQELDLFNMNEYYKCLRIVDDARTNGEKVEGIIRCEDGQINIIKDTDCFAVPEIDGIYDQLAAGNNKLRGKASRTELLSACLDIRSFPFPGSEETCYFVGDIGEGMRWNVQHAANIRKIERYEDSKDMFGDLLPLMDVTFVKNGQLTVNPFPYKYIREWIKQNIY